MKDLHKAVAGNLATGQIQGDRDYQEDEYGVSEVDPASTENAGHTLLVLADGMGGHAGGSQASHIVIRSFLKAYQESEGPVSDRLRASLEQANDAVAEQVEKQPELAGMGCTLVAVVVSHRGLEWLSVGDSLLWKLDVSGTLNRLNADHSMSPVLDELVESGRMTFEEAETDSRKHALRSAITGEDIHLVDLASQPVPLARGEKILLASDGIVTLSEIEIVSAINRQDGLSLDNQVDELLARVQKKEKPGQDNTTVMLFEVDRVLGLPGKEIAEDSIEVAGEAVTNDQDSAETAPPAKPPSAPSKRRTSNPKKSWRMWLSVALIALLVIAWMVSRNAPDSGQDTEAVVPEVRPSNELELPSVSEPVLPDVKSGIGTELLPVPEPEPVPEEETGFPQDERS